MSRLTPPTGLTQKPRDAVSVGNGGAREREQFSPSAETERSGLCDDAAMQEQGVSKILTINLNDMAKELNIK